VPKTPDVFLTQEVVADRVIRARRELGGEENQMARVRLGRGATCVLALGATALAASALFVGPALAQSTNDADKAPMSAVPQFTCDTSTPPGTPTKSFANIKLGVDNSSPPGRPPRTFIDAVVSIKDAAPNESYLVILTPTSLTAPGPLPCGGSVVSVTTNGQGNANTRLTSGLEPDTRSAFVVALGPAGVNHLISTLVVFDTR
jgi:hypothetical protein